MPENPNVAIGLLHQFFILVANNLFVWKYGQRRRYEGVPDGLNNVILMV
jgi:hypothetical protein